MDLDDSMKSERIAAAVNGLKHQTDVWCGMERVVTGASWWRVWECRR